MKKKKIDYKQIIEFLKTPKGKATAFFGFYFVFFLVLAILFRTHSSLDTEYDISTKKELPFSISKIKSGNYHYKYTNLYDNNSDNYEGDKNGTKELFKANDIEYFKDGDIYFTNNSNVWVKTDNPYRIEPFILINNIEKIAEKAKFISKTEYESGMNVYTYQISTTSLLKIIDKEKVDLDDPVNEIVFKTNENNEVNDIKYDLTSYYKYKNVSTKNNTIELEYSNFGKVKDIKQPE